MNQITSLIILLLISVNATAGIWYDVPASEIDHIRADGILVNGNDGGYVLQYKDGITHPGDSGCIARDFAYIRANDKLAKEMYATAMSAFISGKKLKIYTTGCDASGFNVISALGVYRD